MVIIHLRDCVSFFTLSPRMVIIGIATMRHLLHGRVARLGALILLGLVAFATQQGAMIAPVVRRASAAAGAGCFAAARCTARLRRDCVVYLLLRLANALRAV